MLLDINPNNLWNNLLCFSFAFFLYIYKLLQPVVVFDGTYGIVVSRQLAQRYSCALGELLF
jgi:hypothetical protein